MEPYYSVTRLSTSVYIYRHIHICNVYMIIYIRRYICQSMPMRCFDRSSNEPAHTSDLRMVPPWLWLAWGLVLSASQAAAAEGGNGFWKPKPPRKPVVLHSRATLSQVCLPFWATWFSR